MTGLEKWKKEQIENIEKMTAEDVIESVWSDYRCHLCNKPEREEYFVCPLGDADCEKGIKAYLDMEVE